MASWQEYDGVPEEAITASTATHRRARYAQVFMFPSGFGVKLFCSDEKQKELCWIFDTVYPRPAAQGYENIAAKDGMIATSHLARFSIRHAHGD